MLLELEETDLKQIYIDLDRFLENDLAIAFDKINFKDYSPIVDELRNKYKNLKFELTSFGISIEKIKVGA